MKDITIFDVMVVYAHDIATSTSSSNNSVVSPFPKKIDNYNKAYSYFLKSCKKQNLKAAFTTSNYIRNDGTFSAFWTIEKGKWTKVQRGARATIIFDKLSPTTKEKRIMREKLTLSTKNQAFNSPHIFSLFFDKNKTQDFATTCNVPTTNVSNSTVSEIKTSIHDLKKIISTHPTRGDFAHKMILKDRYGAGGNKVYQIGTNESVKKIQKHMTSNKNTSFVLQPFVNFENGYKEFGREGYVDTRIIYLDEKIIQAYVRTAKKNDFRCNEHQGGKLTYISKSDIPAKIRVLSDSLVDNLSAKNGFFALDFILSNKGTVYLLEGNCWPGLDWDLKNKENERKTKLLIRNVVKSISQRFSKNYKYQGLIPQNFVNSIIPKSPPVFKIV